VLPLLILALLCVTSPSRSESQIVPTPTLDRLATPVVPENPTPVDLGRKVYYQNCMPCHGDVGQGLTEEWRNVWVDDHRNCWARGCHGGRVEDEGFPLPQTIPAVIGPEADSLKYASSVELLAYLVKTHPPQHPGILEKAEYEEVTAFLWHENRRDEVNISPSVGVIMVGGLALVILSLALFQRARRTRS
jgi:mono/diheme cytochrome c family protein